MNEQLQNAINEVLLGAVEQAAKGAEFLKGQLPDVVQQLLLWNMIDCVIFFVIGMLLITGAVWGGRWFWKQYKKTGQDTEFSLAFLIPMAGVGACMIVTNVRELLQLRFAPKVWLIEYAASLMKGT